MALQRIHYLILLVTTFLLRLPTLYIPILDVDESQFAEAANALLRGGLPYISSIDTKPMGIYLFYGAILKLFGNYNMLAVHAVTLIWVAFTAVIIALSVNNSLKTQKQYTETRAMTLTGSYGSLGGPGFWAGLFYIIFTSMFLPKYLATSINIIMAPFLILSFVCAEKFYQITTQKYAVKVHYGYWSSFFCGFFLSCAILLKYTAVTQLILYFIALALISYQQKIRKGRIDYGLLLTNGCVYIFGICLLPLCHSLWLYHLGAWDDFWYWSINGSQNYITSGFKTIQLLHSLLWRFGGFALATWLVWYLTFLQIKVMKKGENQNILLLVWLFTSLVPVFVGFRFYSHYFLHVMPVLCWFAGLKWADLIIKHKGLPKNLFMGAIVLPSILFLGLRMNHKDFLTKFPDDQIYEMQAIGQHLNSISNPRDKIFVWGFATAISFFAKRPFATRFYWSDWLSGRAAGPDYARKNQTLATDTGFVWNLFMWDLNQTQPEFIIDTSPANIHGYKVWPITKFKRLADYLQIHYKKLSPYGGVDIYQRLGYVGNERKGL